MAGKHRTLNTLTAARKALTLDDLRLIGQLADFFVEMVDEAPQEVVQHFFSAWVRARCAEVDEAKSKVLGSTTQQMLDFYKMMAEGLADRIATLQPPAKGS